MRISLIIPLRLTDGTYQAHERLNRIVETVPADCFEILVSDYGTDPSHRPVLDELASRGLRVVHHPAPENLFSIGRSRDFGVQMASCPVIMFNDIDFLATTETYRAIHAEVVRRDMVANRFDFFCVPVMFLTEAGSSAWLQASAAGTALFGLGDLAGVEAANDLVQSLAFGSSAMVVNKAHYLATGGHDSGFRGHGAEDYELLHRLSSFAPLAPRPHEYLTDFRSNSVRHYWGFRAFFALYGMDLFAAGITMAHLWHPRRPERGYFRARQNFRFLRKAMLTFDRSARQPPALPDLLADRTLHVVTRHPELVQDSLRMVLPHFSRWTVGAGKLPHGRSADSLLVALVKPGEPVPDGVDASIEVQGRSLTVRHKDGSGPVTARQIELVTRLGIPVSGFLDHLVLPGLTVSSGTIPAQRAATDPILTSFGGPVALDAKHHPRPKKARKSPWYIRLRRFLTRM